MTTRVKVFIDYQNVYHRARGAFDLGDAHPIAGHVRPLRLGLRVKQLGEANDPDRELREVRIYRGEPTGKSHPLVQSAFQRQTAAWREREPMLKVVTRPLRYDAVRWTLGRPVEWDGGHEKGIDVLLALDVVLGAIRDEYDVAVICSGDTDLEPAIDEVVTAGKVVENAVWRGDGAYGRPLKARARRIWVHYLDRTQYDWLHDPTDYTVERGDTGSL